MGVEQNTRYLASFNVSATGGQPITSIDIINANENVYLVSV